MPPCLAPALAAALALAAAKGPAAPWEGPPLSADPRALLAAAAARPAPAGADIEVLLEEARYVYDARGAVTLTHRLVFRPLTAAGAQAWGQVERPWAPWHEARPELRARVITAAGEVRALDPATLSEARAGGAGGLGMPSERRALSGSLPGVEAGSVVEEVATVRELAPAFDGGTSVRFFLAQPAPVRKVRITVEAPAALPLRFAVRGVPEKPRESVASGIRRLTLERRDVPAAALAEPGGPHEVAPIPQIAFGWGRSWADAATRLGGLFDARLEGADLSAAAREAVGEGRPDRAERVRRVVAWVRRAADPSAVEFGEAPLTPAPPAQTLERHGGDGKDLALLLVGLLRAAGLEARVALVRTAWDEVAPELPGVSQFDRALVRVDGEPAIWIDPRDPFAPPGRLHPDAEGRLALVAGAGVKELVRTPESSPEENRARTVRELHLEEMGPGRVVETREITGALAAAERAFRARLGPDAREELAERTAKEVFRAEELGDASVEGLEDPSAPLRTRIEALSSDLVRSEDEGASVPVTPDQVFEPLPPFLGGGAGPGAPRGPVHGERAGPRRSDALLALPYRWEVTYRVFVPDGLRPGPLPAAATERFGPARFESAYAVLPDGSVTATFVFDTGGRRLAAADADRLAARVREIVGGRGPRLTFERTSAALLAKGEVAAGLAEIRRLAALHPREALHPLQLALAFLSLGFADAAAAEARRAIALEPERAWAFRVLGFVLEHDAVGRFHGPGFDRRGALAAYRTAKRLDPDHAGGRAALAELLAHGPDGVRHGPGARLDLAAAEYRAIREDLDEKDYAAGELATIFAAGEDAEAERLAREVGRGPERDAILLAVVAARHGPAAAKNEALGLGEAGPGALRDAARLLLRRRAHPAAGALALAAAELAPDRAEAKQQAELFQGLRRWEETMGEGGPAERLARRALAAAVSAKDPEKALRALVARRRLGPELAAQATRGLAASLIGARHALKEQGISSDVMLDLLLSHLVVATDGDAATGLRIRVRLPASGGGGPVLFAVREGEELLVLASDGGWPVLGAEALRLADAGDLAAARRLLGFAREVAPGDASKPASPGGLLAALLPDDAAAGANAQVRHAAAALAAFGDRKGRVAPLLLDARARAPRGAERAALGLALAQAYRAAGRSDALLRLSTELLAEDPASREAFGLQVVALEKLRRRAPLDGAADGILAVLPDDPEVLAVVGNARLALGDPQGARSAFRRLIDAGKASPGVYNNAAWLELFFEPPAPEALEWARKAAGAERALDAAALNTLAAVQATVGQPTDARATFLRSLEAGGGGAPGPADWFVFGRIAEAYGLPEVARAAYARVRPEPEDPTAPNLLARRRLVALGPAPATEPARPATRKPAAAPAPGPKKTPDEKGPPPRKPQRKKPEPDHPERTIPA